jgi:MFS transporter, Spinster family, sphingosine-1-phosphate transporter
MEKPYRTPALARGAFWVLLALFAMNLLNFVDRFILAAVLGSVQDPHRGLDLTDFQAGVLGSSFYISYAVFSPLIGWLGDRVTRKYLLAGSVAVWSVATFGTGLAQSFGQMVVARGLLGVGEAAYAALAPTLIADLFPRAQRGRALTFFYIAVPLGAAIGYPLGGAIDSAYGWRAAFTVVGLPGLAVALAALALPEPARGGVEGVAEEDRQRHQALPFSWRIYASLARNPSYIYNTLGMAMFAFALGGLQHWGFKYFQGTARPDGLQPNAWLGPVLAVSGLVGTWLGGWLGERLARRWRGGYFWLSGLTMAAAVPFIVPALLTGQLAVVIPCLLIGLTLSFMNIGPSNTILANVSDPKIRAAAVAINLFIMHWLGDIPSPSLMGLVSDLTGSDAQHMNVWGMAITLPALLLGGVFFCLGAPHLCRDQDAVLEQMRSGKV